MPTKRCRRKGDNSASSRKLQNPSSANHDEFSFPMDRDALVLSAEKEPQKCPRQPRQTKSKSRCFKSVPQSDSFLALKKKDQCLAPCLCERKPREDWSDDELNQLAQGVRDYGRGNWTDILSHKIFKRYVVVISTTLRIVPVMVYYLLIHLLLEEGQLSLSKTNGVKSKLHN